MALTLGDAQHLCWKMFKKIVDKNRNKTLTGFQLTNDLQERASEVKAMIRELRVYKNPTDLKKRRLAEKLSSMLYISFILAENNNINLEESFLQTINDYILEFVT